MNHSLQTYGPGHAGATASATQRNRILRNTYWLLALSMVPTVLGAWIGVSTGVAGAMSPGIGLVVFLAGAFGFMYAIEKTKNSAAGVPVLLAFTFFMGLMLSRLVGTVLGLANGASLVMTAFAGTGAIFLGMASLSTLIKRDLSAMGKWLFVGAIMLLVAGIANVFIQSSALMITLARLAITKNTPAVPANAVMMRSVPFLKPSTMPIRRESIRPMKNVKASSTGTPAAERLVFSIANMKANAPPRNTIKPTPPRSDWVMPVATPTQAPSTVGIMLSASSQ
jgi:modulator of FtsH protease